MRLKLLKNYIAEIDVLFSLICWSSLEPVNVYIFMYIVSCYDVKDVHYSFSKNIHLQKMHYISGRWRREEGVATLMIKKVIFRGTVKSAIKSMHWKVALRQQVQLLFSI